MVSTEAAARSGHSFWTVAFAALTAVLTGALFLQVRANRGLRRDLAGMTAQRARESGLAEGKVLEAIQLLDAGGAMVPVRFTEAVGTVLLFHASSCGACEATVPAWRTALLAAARPDVRVVCIQTDAEGAPLQLNGLPPSLAVPLPPEGWLAALPAVPATLILDEDGRLTRAWFGELDEEARQALVAAIERLGT